MKIDKTPPPPPSSQIGDITPRANNPKPTTANAPSGTSVHLGTGTAQLRSLEKSVANSPVADVEKVNAIKQAISEGKFHVNTSVVADRLIDSVKELISANKTGAV